MGQRIDHQILHTGLLRKIDRFEIAGGAVGRFQVDGQVFADGCAANLLSHIQGAGFVLRIDQAEPFPDLSVRQLGMRGSYLAVAQEQGALGLA